MPLSRHHYRYTRLDIRVKSILQFHKIFGTSWNYRALFRNSEWGFQLCSTSWFTKIWIFFLTYLFKTFLIVSCSYKYNFCIFFVPRLTFQWFEDKKTKFHRIKTTFKMRKTQSYIIGSNFKKNMMKFWDQVKFLTYNILRSAYLYGTPDTLVENNS